MVKFQIRNCTHTSYDCSWQEHVFLGLRDGDLVDEQPNSTFGNDVRCTIADLDAHHSLGCTDSHHGEQVDNWVCAPADDRGNLSHLDLATDVVISLGVCGGGQPNEELSDNVQEE